MGTRPYIVDSYTGDNKSVSISIIEKNPLTYKEQIEIIEAEFPKVDPGKLIITSTGGYLMHVLCIDYHKK